METGKRSRGRPKKESSERLEQFSIRLNYELKMAVDLIAARERLSLSQVVDRAVDEWVGRYPLSVGQFLPFVRQKRVELFAQLIVDAEEEIPGFANDPDAYPEVTERVKAITTLLMVDTYARLLLAPEELLSDEDKHFVNIVDEIGLWKNFEVLQGVRTLSDSAYRSGLGVMESVERVERALPAMRERKKSEWRSGTY